MAHLEAKAEADDLFPDEAEEEQGDEEEEDESDEVHAFSEYQSFC